MKLDSASPGIASVPDHVIITAGSFSADAPYTPIAPGQAVFRATSSDSEQTTIATVVDSLRITSDGSATFEMGAHGIIAQQMNITLPEPITLSLDSSQVAVAAVDNELVIPAFSGSGFAQVTTLTPGVSVITSSYHGQQSTQLVTVVNKARIAQVYGTNLLEVGGSGQAQLRLNAQLATATPLGVTPGDPAVIGILNAYTISAGSDYAYVDIQGCSWVPQISCSRLTGPMQNCQSLCSGGRSSRSSSSTERLPWARARC